MSWVILTAHRAFKLKKPVRFHFLDLSRRDARRRACEEEVRVNQALAADVVLGVRAVMREPEGGYALADPDAAADPVDWVVEMRRFDEDRTMAAAVARGDLREADVATTARRIADFHEKAARPPAGDWARALARAWTTNVDELADAAGPFLEARRTEAARRFASSFARRRAAELDRRAAKGRVVDGHGDLRAEHVLLGDGTVTIVDRLEFDRRLRRVDVADDLAFLVMDLHALGAGWAAEALVGAYRAAGGDPGDAGLVAAFAAYRALVRAKVGLLRAAQLSDPKAGEARDRALALVALAERLAWTARGPLCIVVAGPPASGKSTVAAALRDAARIPVLSSDVVRKELLGIAPRERAPSDAYTPDARRRIYEVLGERAAHALGSDSVVVDATFGAAAQREAFLAALGAAHRARVRLVVCEAPVDVRVERARRRMAASAGASDADADVVRRLDAADFAFGLDSDIRLAVDTTSATAGVADRIAAWLDEAP
jgi:aminoglycoside phosphotransferase family enzyme/predicted kinase